MERERETETEREREGEMKVHDIMYSQNARVYTSACTEHVKNAFNPSVCVDMCNNEATITVLA